MNPYSNSTIDASKLELKGDSAWIVVRDWSKQLREELSEEEASKYANQAYLDHLKLKASNAAKADADKRSSKYDGLLEATQARKPDYSKAQGRPEVGVSIQVGIKTEADNEQQQQADEPMEDNLEEGGVCIESPFDFDDY